MDERKPKEPELRRRGPPLLRRRCSSVRRGVTSFCRAICHKSLPALRAAGEENPWSSAAGSAAAGALAQPFESAGSGDTLARLLPCGIGDISQRLLRW